MEIFDGQAPRRIEHLDGIDQHVVDAQQVRIDHVAATALANGIAETGERQGLAGLDGGADLIGRKGIDDRDGLPGRC